jgi:O-antigen ligase
MIRRLTTYWDVFAALPMLLALETQLRAGGAAVGPGEALLSLWLLPVLFAAIWNGPRSASRQFLNALGFWAALAAALCLGVIIATVRDIAVDWSLVIHDTAAYILLALVTCTLTILPNAAARLYGIQWMIALFGASLLLMQLANAGGFFVLSDIDPWYWDRMRGWSENPNQFALLCLLTGFVAVALAERATGVPAKIVASICAGIALGTGLQSKSNAYSAVVIAGLLVLALLKAGRWMARAERAGRPAIAVFLIGISALGLATTLLASAVDLRADFEKATRTIARKGEDESADAALRLQLWKQAITVGTRSWALGLGPGPHLEIPPSIIAGRQGEDDPINLKHPKPGLAANFEAHNTVLELFVQGGLLAVVAFLWILALAARRAWKAGFDGLVALLFVLIMFGSFHVVFRHPFVWFAICLALVSEPAPRAAARTSEEIPPAVDRHRFAFAAGGRGRRCPPLAVQRL